MAVKPVSLTYIGDASEALKWVGFAKKKARQLGEWCAATGMPTGQNYLSPVPDVSIRVWYTNGLLNARIEASGKPFGFAFKRHDQVNTVDGFWWNIARPRDNVFIDISKGVRARGLGKYHLGSAGTIEYGSWPCQERANGELFTIAKYKLFAGRGSPTFPTPTRAVSSRRQVRMDIGYPGSDEGVFFRNGRAYEITNDDCYGVFKFADTLFTVEFDGTYTTSAPQGTTTVTTIFNTGTDMRLIQIDGGPSAASVVASRTEIASHDVSYYTMVNHVGHEWSVGLFLSAPDGSASMAKYYDTPTSVNTPVVYLRMAQSELGVITGTFSTVEVAEEPTGAVVPYKVHGRYFDFVLYQGAYVPARVAKIVMSETSVVGGYDVVEDFIVEVDADFSGAFSTEVFRIVGSTPKFYSSLSEVVTSPSELNLGRGIVPAIHDTIKIDFTDWSYTVLTGDTPNTSLAHTRMDYIFAGRNDLYVPQYTDGELTGYTAMAVEDIPGMAAALGDGYLASDATGTYGFLGTI